MQRGVALAAAATAAAALVAPQALAAGFAIREQSASFQGLSFAGVAAGGADISTMYFNPATLALHDEHSLHASLSLIFPRAEFTLDAATDGAGNPLSGGAGDDIAEDPLLPALYAMVPYGDLRVGLGITSPFGLRTQQPVDWVGRYHATESELTTINVNPVVAWRVSERWSVAAGFVAQYAEATLANARDLSGAAPPSPATDALAEVDGKDWDFGFTLGALVEPLDGTRLGLGYRSRINHSLTGDFRLTAGGGTLLKTAGRAALATPRSVSLGVRQRLTDAVDVLGTVEWTDWSSFDELRVVLDNGTRLVTEEDWNDSWFVALGGEYRPRPDVTLQLSIAHDRSPIEDDLRTPRIPGNDRTWISLGAAWAPRAWLTVGAGYSRIFVADGDIDLSEGPTDLGGRGTLRGTFENAIDILALHGTLRF